MLEEFYDYHSMEIEIAMKMMLVHRVKEPTFTQVQKNSENLNEVRKPAWIMNAEEHPGLPDHYLAVNEQLNKSLETSNNEQYICNLPFEVNREIHMKLLVAPLKARRTEKKLPNLGDLMNGTIVICGEDLPLGSENNIEIFLSLHEKLLPCCVTQRSNILFRSPSTEYGRARCYFIPDASAPKEISFLSSSGQVLHQTSGYQVKWFYGSTPYKFLHF